MSVDDEKNAAANESNKEAAASAPILPPAFVSMPPTLVVVHPLVLLSTVDHYNRVARETSKRVVGILLGSTFRGKVDVTNSYAVPFEEDPKDPNVWYLDRNYHEAMFAMSRRIAAKEKVVGWYSTGPKIRPADLEINDMMRKYHPNPVLVIIDVNQKDDVGLPTEAYYSIEDASEERSENRKSFVHVPSEIGALEAEEIGVEHLLRDIRDTTISSLSTRIDQKRGSLHALQNRVDEMLSYINSILDDKLPTNHQIIYYLQDIFNLSPNLRVHSLVDSFNVKSNDQYLAIYLSAMVRAIIALHNLINNKLENNEARKKKVDKKDKTKEKEGNDVQGDKTDADIKSEPSKEGAKSLKSKETDKNKKSSSK